MSAGILHEDAGRLHELFAGPGASCSGASARRRAGYRHARADPGTNTRGSPSRRADSSRRGGSRRSGARASGSAGRRRGSRGGRCRRGAAARAGRRGARASASWPAHGDRRDMADQAQPPHPTAEVERLECALSAERAELEPWRRSMLVRPVHRPAVPGTAGHCPPCRPRGTVRGLP